jgi:hypothetical protein
MRDAPQPLGLTATDHDAAAGRGEWSFTMSRAPSHRQAGAWLAIAVIGLYASAGHAHDNVMHYERQGDFHFKTYKPRVSRQHINACSLLATRVRHQLGANREGQQIVPMVHIFGRTVRSSHRSGLRLGELGAAAQARAREAIGRAIRTAQAVSYGLPIDGNHDNFRFYEDGEIRGWFDLVFDM